MKRQLIDAVQDAEMVIIDNDGHDGADMRSADPQTLPGDHDHSVFRDSSLHTLRAGRRWWWQWCSGRS